MITEYRIDFNYLTSLLRKSTPLDMHCECAFRLYDILCSENGRLLLGADDDGKDRLLAYLGKPSRSLHDIKRDFVVEQYLTGLYTNFGVKKERPCIRRTDGAGAGRAADYFIGEGDDAIGLARYFEREDKKRRKMLGQQTFVSSEYENPNVTDRSEVCFEGFDRQLHAFAAGEKKGFVIVDAYCLGGRMDGPDPYVVAKKVKVLMHWVYHLSNEGECPLTFDVYTSCPYVQESNRPNYEAGILLLQERLEVEMKTIWEKVGFNTKRHDDRWPIKIVFHVIRNTSDARGLLHDRYIGSSTHFFAIGRGLDGVMVNQGGVAYNVYYCGKGDIRESRDMKRIVDYVRYNWNPGEIFTTEVLLDGYVD